MSLVRAWSAKAARQPLEMVEIDLGPLKPTDVEISVESCGLCHTDLSFVQDDWGVSPFPLVPGHEAIGRVVAVGEQALGLRVGQRVGVGYNAGSCMHCRTCLGGDQHLCVRVEPTMLGGHQGAFAERIRSHWAWAVPLPDTLDTTTAGPLLCGGVTVFAPLLEHRVRPSDRVGVIGIGGLGHLALQFARAWGCEVTAFTSNLSKSEEARSFGAHHVVETHDTAALAEIAASLDLLLVTVNVTLDWAALLQTLKPKGRMHVVGVVAEAMPIHAFPLIAGQKAISGSPTGNPVTIATMLEFAARHGIAPQVQRYPMSQVNDAMARLAAGEARYRIVLDADFA
jgi:uncharacterized zinc-type alcohol dehydrogenase-like protein